MRETPNNKRESKENILDYEIELRRFSKDKLDRSSKMENKQHNNDRVFEMIKKVRIDLSVKENETFIKKRENRSCHNLKEIRTEIIVSNIHETRRTIIYKKLSR